MCVVLLAFAWPTATSRVENLTVAVVGSQEQVDAVTQKMPEHLLELHPMANSEDAVNGITSREVCGGIVLGEQPEILTASAASPVASQMLTGVETNMQRWIDQQVIAGMQQAPQKMASGGGAAPVAPGLRGSGTKWGRCLRGFRAGPAWLGCGADAGSHGGDSAHREGHGRGAPVRRRPAGEIWAPIGWPALGIILTVLGHHKKEWALRSAEG